ncbi:MAG: kinase/pyrophosphorylase [Proteobacteria bacterium]|nr:kinase/pyrophosphorylase [Pseudomonadota bacterium]
MSGPFHLHLISDATGETLNAIAKAAVAQFEGVEVREHFYALVRSRRQLERVVEHIRDEPGLVFFTLVNPELRRELEAQCSQMKVPCQGVLDGPISMMGKFLGSAETHRPGGQHEVDQRYLQRIEALNFTITHDDGQNLDGINDAEVVLTGASRTSKTPTCVYLAIRGIRAANVPIVPNIPLPAQLLSATKPLVVGLWASPDRLIQVRRNRLQTLGEVRDTSYIDLENVRHEVTATRKLFDQQGWPAIDVSRRSVEETAAAVLNLLGDRNSRRGDGA